MNSSLEPVVPVLRLLELRPPRALMLVHGSFGLISSACAFARFYDVHIRIVQDVASCDMFWPAAMSDEDYYFLLIGGRCRTYSSQLFLFIAQFVIEKPCVACKRQNS